MSGILVVCTGNVCRSPMAEGLLRAALVDRLGLAAPAVTSAGTAGWEGAGATREAIVAAGEHGVDIGGHLARELRPAMLEETDLVLCMAAEHRDAVVRARPDVADRTFTIAELVRVLPDGPADGALAERIAAAAAARNGASAEVDVDVRDPLGDPIEGYREVAARLADLSSRLADALAGARA
jgi:protein-tyrosine phosphatase